MVLRRKRAVEAVCSRGRENLATASSLSSGAGKLADARVMSLPRVLICSQCGHGAFIKSGRPARSPSVTRDEEAALRAA